MTFVTPTLLTDGYKIDHRRQYPKETKTVYSNMTPRKSRMDGVNEVVVFGIQYYIIKTLIETWNEKFFKADINEITEEFMQEMEEYTLSKQAASDIGIEHWKALHKLGYLPLLIKAIPEGLRVPIGVPVYSVTNTHHDFYWLPNFIETDMSSELWGMMTSATIAAQYRGIFDKWCKKTGGNPEFVPFQGHDFSYRGMFGREAAMMSGAGHLLSFVGTDTIPAIKFLKKYYKADTKDGIIGCSVFATEHAVMCVGTGFYIKKKDLTWEKYGEAEFEVFKRLITEVYPTGILSIVCDTWNLWVVLTDYVVRLRKEIVNRDGKVVFRPDSGDPADIICGTSTAPARAYKVIKNEASKERAKWDWAEKQGVVNLLWNVFGGTKNALGLRTLDSHVGVIYGDSITPERAEDICKRLSDMGYTSDNWVAGIGSFTYQYKTRDSLGFAQKATWAEVDIDGKLVGIDIFKDPITDNGEKKSAKGLLCVKYDPVTDKIDLMQECTRIQEQQGLLRPVFENGKLMNEVSLAEMRKLVATKAKTLECEVI